MLAVLVAPLTACAPTIMQASLAPSDVTLAATMLEAGTGSVRGSALLRQRGGVVVTCAGNDVYLVPGTSSAQSEMRRIFGGDAGYQMRGGAPITGGGTIVVAPQPNRKATCDAQGFFRFANVRPGKWYVITDVTWLSGDSTQGGSLLGSADVVEGKEAELVLSSQ
jgi:hypothetical protein